MARRNKRHDARLVRLILEEAVEWFREAAAHPENADRDLVELARECANGAFKNNASLIMESKQELIARWFMDACAKKFSVEIPKFLAEAREPKAELVC